MTRPVVGHLTAGVLGSALLLIAPAFAQHQRGQGANAGPAQPDAASRVDLSAFEEDPSRYLGQTVTLEGEVARVLGPRLFSIDERNWMDLDGETLVLVPTPLAALVHTDQPVVVTGTVQPFVQAEIQRALGWLTPMPFVGVQVAKRPVIAASSVTSGPATSALLDLNVHPPAPDGGAATQPEIGDIGQLASATTTELVGRRVSISGVRIADVTEDGFWVEHDGESLFILNPSDATRRPTLVKGQTVGVEGVVLEFPRQRARHMGDRARDEAVYVQARQIS